MEMMTSIWIEQKGEFSITPTSNKAHLTKIIYAEILSHNPFLHLEYRLLKFTLYSKTKHKDLNIHTVMPVIGNILLLTFFQPWPIPETY